MKAVPPQLESKWAGSTDDVAHDRIRAAKMFESLPDLLLIHSAVAAVPPPLQYNSAFYACSIGQIQRSIPPFDGADRCCDRRYDRRGDGFPSHSVLRSEDRARSLGWLSAGTNVGTMLGPVIGSFATYWGHQWPGILAASLCVANALFAWQWLPESKQPQAHAPGRKPVWHGVWMVLRNPAGNVQRLTLIYAVAMLAFSCLTSVLALYLSAEFGITEKTIGYVFLYVGIFSVLMRSALIGPIVDRIGEPWSIRAGAATLILGLLAYPLAPNLWSLAFIVPLVPIGTSLLFPATTALMSHHSPRSELGTTMGIAQTFAGISRVVAPLVSTTLFQRISHGMPFYFAATFVGVVSLLAFQVERQPAPEPVRVID